MAIGFAHEISVEDYNFLRKSVGWYEFDLEQAKTGLDHSAYLVTARDGGRTVGMARVVSDGGCVALIVDVIVLPDYQGQGIGKSLMGFVMEYLNRSMKMGQRLFVNLMAAKGKEAFYQQFGFVERPNDQLGAGMSQLIVGSC